MRARTSHQRARARAVPCRVTRSPACSPRPSSAPARRRAARLPQAPTELPAGVSRVQPMSMAAAEAEAEAALPGKGGASAGLPSELTGWQQQQPAAGLAQAPGQAGAAGAGPASQAQPPAAAPAPAV